MTANSTIPLFLLSFNIGKSQLDADAFTDELVKVLPQDVCDIYVFGFQELCPILDGCFEDYANKYLEQINEVLLQALKSKYTFELDQLYNFTTIGIHHIGSTGIMAITPFALKFKSPRFARASCGYGKSLLKGGVGLRVSFEQLNGDPTELTFAAVHLSALEGEFYYRKRLDDIQTIMRALDFGDGFSFIKPQCHAFLLGDMNFRTTQDIKARHLPVFELSTLQDNSDGSLSNEISRYVAKYDELSLGRSDSEVLPGFDEPVIAFRPTYKFHVNTAIYNTKRCPLWCDRIFYQATYSLKKQATPHAYDCILSYFGSDHRPVYLHITVPVQAPRSIIAPNGNLLILPMEYSRGPKVSSVQFDALKNSVSGPTQIYLKYSTIDFVQQKILRCLSDTIIGYGLWLTQTPKGRLWIFGVALVVLLVYCMQ